MKKQKQNKTIFYLIGKENKRLNTEKKKNRFIASYDLDKQMVKDWIELGDFKRLENALAFKIYKNGFE